MKREEIKTYKDACKVIGRKPRTYKDKHLNLYEQLSTITAALNFISNNNKPWEPKFDYYYIYSWLYRRSGYNKSAGLFYLDSSGGLDYSYGTVGTRITFYGEPALPDSPTTLELNDEDYEQLDSVESEENWF